MYHSHCLSASTIYSMCLGCRLARLSPLTEATDNWYNLKRQPKRSLGPIRLPKSPYLSGVTNRVDKWVKTESNPMRRECRGTSTILDSTAGGQVLPPESPSSLALASLSCKGLTTRVMFQGSRACPFHRNGRFDTAADVAIPVRPQPARAYGG
jgi:hypothetical protein